LEVSGQTYARPPTTPEGWQNRAEQVKAAFVHAYHGYEKYAWKWDELRPMSHQGQNKYVIYFKYN